MVDTTHFNDKFGVLDPIALLTLLGILIINILEYVGDD
jgi:hypothetical protein